jgi:hypothetical protein
MRRITNTIYVELACVCLKSEQKVHPPLASFSVAVPSPDLQVEKQVTDSRSSHPWEISG